MLYAVLPFNKRGRGPCLDDLALSAVQVEHSHIHGGIMNLLPPHYKCRIDHLDRRLLRESCLQKLLQKLDHERALPARLLSRSHPVREYGALPSAGHLHHREIISRYPAASLPDPRRARHRIICRPLAADDRHVSLSDHLGAVALRDEPPARRLGDAFDKLLHRHLLLLHRARRHMHLILSLSVHKKMRIQHTKLFLFQMRHDLFLQAFVGEDAVLQFLRRAPDHIGKCVHLDRAPLPAPCDPVRPYQILARLVESLQHLPQEPRRHDAPLHQLPLCLCIEFVSIMVYGREHFIPHLVSMYEVLSPAPGTFFALLAHLLLHPVKHAVDLVAGKRLLSVLETEKRMRQLL